jgi:hypothetical protein
MVARDGWVGVQASLLSRVIMHADCVCIQMVRAPLLWNYHKILEIPVRTWLLKQSESKASMKITRVQRNEDPGISLPRILV